MLNSTRLKIKENYSKHKYLFGFGIHHIYSLNLGKTQASLLVSCVDSNFASNERSPMKAKTRVNTEKDFVETPRSIVSFSHSISAHNLKWKKDF
mmetsp:Transcript_23209/g.33140  ORF Transcript_23209/g.33140 Transcript_23209/m.33140 type:complete len:94 (-) Transcript_23209:879-1160(-)